MTMASILKRKRGAAQKEDVEALKRPKATTDTLEKPATDASGTWDKLFAPLHKSLNNEIAVINGTNDNSEDNTSNTQLNGKKKKGKKSKSIGSNAAGWRVSAPFGGRMVDIDPVFTEDEK